MFEADHPLIKSGLTCRIKHKVIEITSKYKLSKKNFDVFVKSLFSEAKGGNSDLIFRTKMGLGAQKMSKMKTPKQNLVDLNIFDQPTDVHQENISWLSYTLVFIVSHRLNV